jgi:hypothetical protein
MTFTNVLDPARIGASPKGVSDAHSLLRGELEILARIPTVGRAEISALFDDPFHRQSLA